VIPDLPPLHLSTDGAHKTSKQCHKGLADSAAPGLPPTPIQRGSFSDQYHRLDFTSRSGATSHAFGHQYQLQRRQHAARQRVFFSQRKRISMGSLIVFLPQSSMLLIMGCPDRPHARSAERYSLAMTRTKLHSPQHRKVVMTAQDLRHRIARLREHQPITIRLEQALCGDAVPNGRWYHRQKQHWLGWLYDYDGPGYYRRRDWERSEISLGSTVKEAQTLKDLFRATPPSSALRPEHQCTRTARAKRQEQSGSTPEPDLIACK
jgi:hypothetical protein